MFAGDFELNGGISFVILEYLKAGLHKKLDLFLIPTSRGRSKVAKIFFFPAALVHTIRTITVKNIDICHLHVSQDGSFYRKLFVFWIAKILRCKVILQIHGSKFEKFMTRDILNRLLTKSMFNRSDSVIVLSERFKSKLSEFATKARVVKLYNPAPMLSGSIGGQKPTEGLNVLFLGQLSRRKGVYDLLSCILDQREYFLQQKVRFILAGDGDVAEVRSFVDRNGLEQLLEIPGWISGKTKHRYLSEADIYVLPSYNEQMPMSILEAMAYGIPVISTFVAGIPELIETGKNGILVHAGDREGLSSALQELISSDEKRTRMGRETRKKVLAEFDPEYIVQQLVSIYKIL